MKNNPLLHVIPFGLNHGFQFSALAGIRARCIGKTVGRYTTDGFGRQEETVIRAQTSPAHRFPYAERFRTAAVAALEADFWKFVLNQRYFIPVQFSTPCPEDIFESAALRGRNFAAELADESKWSEELKDFLAQYDAHFLAYREANKPDRTGETFLGSTNPELRAWARKRVEAQALKRALTDCEIERVHKRLMTCQTDFSDALNHIRRARELMPSDDVNEELKTAAVKIQQMLATVETSLASAAKPLSDWTAFLTEAKSRCETLDANRPSDIAPVCAHDGPATFVRRGEGCDVFKCNACLAEYEFADRPKKLS